MRILIADDQKDFAIFLERLVCALNHEVPEVVTSGGLAVIQAYERHKPDLVLMDFHMPQFNGVTACRHILSKHPAAQIVVISGDSQQSLDRAVNESGAVGALRKPFSSSELASLLAAVTPNASSDGRVVVRPKFARESDRSDPPLEGVVPHV